MNHFHHAADHLGKIAVHAATDHSAAEISPGVAAQVDARGPTINDRPNRCTGRGHPMPATSPARGCSRASTSGKIVLYSLTPAGHRGPDGGCVGCSAGRAHPVWPPASATLLGSQEWQQREPHFPADDARGRPRRAGNGPPRGDDPEAGAEGGRGAAAGPGVRGLRHGPARHQGRGGFPDALRAGPRGVRGRGGGGRRSGHLRAGRPGGRRVPDAVRILPLVCPGA